MTGHATRVALLPLDAETIRTRLERDDFQRSCDVEGRPLDLHFGPEFPGDALVLYRRLLDVAVEGIVDGMYVIVDLDSREAVGQLGTMGPPTGDPVEIGYGINASASGRGIATSAVAALMSLLEARPEVGSVVARSAVDNPASGRVLEKNGFLVTGHEDSDEGELVVWHRRKAAPLPN
jgi:ribosomal-protein-alanine N-acetyltransferase